MSKKFYAALIAILLGVSLGIAVPKAEPERIYPYPNAVATNPVAQYEGAADDEAELKDLHVPVPMKDRVFNKTSIQCVWCSCELLGRYAEEPKLINLTDDPECKSYSSPSSAARKLNKIKVKFVQTTNRAEGRAMLRKAVTQERRGALFGVPGHAMNCVHYDEEKGVFKYINNSDRTLKVRTWTMSEFERRWDGWVLVIYADNDIIPQKYQKQLMIPIIDRNGPQGNYPKDYIPLPGKN